MAKPAAPANPTSQFLQSEAAGGIVLIIAALAALLAANSPLAQYYFSALAVKLAGLPVLHWINDGLMAVFFLLVGLEMKRELLAGELSSWRKRALPAFAALGGMVAPALVYLAVNAGYRDNLGGWAIPAATDIAFALGILSLLGRRVPASLKIFLTALAILDDLGAVIIIALFYTHQLHWWALGGAAAVTLVLAGLNIFNVRRLWPYLLAGVALWYFMHESGIHATIAGVILALAVPQRAGSHSPLQSLEHLLHKPVAFAIVPLFGFANAGVILTGTGALANPVTLGIGLGLFFGKQIGVFGATLLALGLGLADRPKDASLTQIYGIALLCGVGFTMSLFIGLLAFAGNGANADAVKIGVLAGSLASALAGAGVLILAKPRRSAR